MAVTAKSQRAELDRRVADDDEFPDDVVPWDEVKASVRARLGR
jgi:putative addiction module component (TIGR02574 family)